MTTIFCCILPRGWAALKWFFNWVGGPQSPDEEPAMDTIVTTFFFLSAFFPGMLRVQAEPMAPASANVDPSVVEAADKYLNAVLAGDAASIGAMYREDAVLMPMDCPLLRGRGAIEQYYRQWFKGPAKITAFSFTHLESPVLGDIAFDVGTYRQTLSLGTSGNINVSGKYSVILKRSAGDWKIAYLIFNGDSPSKMPSAVGN